MTRNTAAIVIGVTVLVLILVGAIANASGGVPSGNVATVDNVGDIPIKGPGGFDHWYVIVNASQQSQQGSKGKAKPPPARTTPQGQQLTQQVMQFLLTADWIAGEAKGRGVDVSDAEIQRQFQQTKKQSFPTDKAYQKFLKQSNQSQQDILYRVKLEVLSNKIRAAITKSSSGVSDQEISDYYDKNKSQFSQPETRDIQEVVVSGANDKSKAKANAALGALKSGQSFASVIKQYSNDPATKANHGNLQGVTKGTQDPALDAAIFSAIKGKLVGPVKTAQGYAVFSVTKIQKGNQQSLAQSKSGIKQLLVSQKQQQKLNTFQTTFKNTWRVRTECASEYAQAGTPYAVTECGNVNPNATQSATPTPPTAKGQKKPVPGSSGQNPPALDNPGGSGTATNLVGSGSGGPVLQPAAPAAAQQSPLGGAPSAPANTIPLALGGAPKKTPGLPAGGLPGGIPPGAGGGAPPAPPPGQ